MSFRYKAVLERSLKEHRMDFDGLELFGLRWKDQGKKKKKAEWAGLVEQGAGQVGVAGEKKWECLAIT